MKTDLRTAVEGNTLALRAVQVALDLQADAFVELQERLTADRAESLIGFEGRTITVHNAPGSSLQGVLLHAYRDCLVLAHARSLDDEADLAGEIVIPRTPGLWIQATVVEPAP